MDAESQPFPIARPGHARPRVGILTFHNTTNYGATLQAVGLMRAVSRRGCDAEVIDYRPSLAGRYYRPRLRKRDGFPNLAKTFKFRLFSRRHLKLTPTSCADPADLPGMTMGRYDAVIVGSDQVWNVKENFRPFDASFYLNFVERDRVRRLSYAASFGAQFPLDPFRDRIAAELRQFDHLSVRDEHSRGLVREISARDPVVVADPTLLDDLSDLEVPPFRPRPFALYYGPDAAGIGSHAVRWCEPRNVSICFLGYRGPVGAWSRIAIGPGEWMGYVRAASMVITSTFHGAVFAAKMGRPFIVIARDWNAIKITDFVARIGLSHRVFRSESCPPTVADELWSAEDVIGAQPKIEQLRAQSDAYLDQALQFGPRPSANL
jgi:hypothetical protein